MKIREDLTGVVTAYDEGGVLVVLHPGDDVPECVEVGEHVLDTPAKKTSAKKPASKSDDN